MSKPIAQLYAVVGQGTALSLQRLMMTGDLQQIITTTFIGMYEEFHAGKKAVTYAPSYEPDPDEYFSISNYEKPAFLAKSDTNPDTFSEYRPIVGTGGTTVKAILAIVTGSADGEVLFLFQYFDRRKLLNQTKLTILFRGGTFARLTDPGIMVGDHIDASIKARSLTFRSFFLASQFLPLSTYFHEANDEDIREFVGNPLFVGGSADQVIQSANQITRKRISIVLKSGILSGDVTPHKLKSAAREFDLDLKVVVKKQKQKIEFPQDPSTVRILLHFLAEGMYVGPITGEPYIANSYRRMK
jgi:hypothetical protein